MTEPHTFDYSAQGRAGRTTYLLALKGPMRTSEIAESVGLTTGAGVRAMMANLSSAGVPIYQPEPGSWALRQEELYERFGQRSAGPKDLL
jgi:hypothetical protein